MNATQHQFSLARAALHSFGHTKKRCPIRMLVAATLVLPSALSLAQLSSTGPFVGSMSEGFESFASSTHYATLSIFGGAATMNSIPTSAEHMYIYVAGGWGLGDLGIAGIHGGSKALGLEDIVNPSGNQDAEIVFGSPVTSFGGYFALEAHNSSFLRFFDSSNTQIGTDQALISATSTQAWQGWNSTIGIARIEIDSVNDYVSMDDLQASAVPEPSGIWVLGLGALALLRRRTTA